jgi:ABC-type amino acid transport system permease subunit
MTALNHVDTQETAGTTAPARRKGPMEQVIETLASGLGNSVAWLAENGVLFAVFTLIWLAFGAGLIWSQGSIDQTWQTIRGLPLIVQAFVWLLFLPVMIGLWIWETTWPLVVRLILVIGIAGWNLLVFLPRALQTAKP